MSIKEKVPVVAKKLAKKHGVAYVTRATISREIGCSPASIEISVSDLVRGWLESGEYEKIGNYSGRVTHPDVRRASMLAAGERVAERIGFHNVNLAEVAKQAGCSRSLIVHHFGSLQDYRKALLKYCIERESYRALYSCINERSIPRELKRKVIEACL